ncbi:hypothetical protein CSA80_05020 [Candidatus Saccharibacteria bacterium]|nr:MAG: hypothetical protein CSA80_05020 [Candidatus Saccharibacteria bacterium]
MLQLLVAGGVMGVLDFLWLGTVAKTFYRSQIGKLLLDKPNMTAAVLFYVIYVVGVVMFVISPALEKGSLGYAVTRGALFGFVAYATYDLTNLATMKGFTTKVVLVDLLWGAALTAIVAAVTYLILYR